MTEAEEQEIWGVKSLSCSRNIPEFHGARHHQTGSDFPTSSKVTHVFLMLLKILLFPTPHPSTLFFKCTCGSC